MDHSAYVYEAYKRSPVSVVDGYFPNDHTHTSPEGAELVAKAFVRAVICGGGLLGGYVRNDTKAIEAECVNSILV